MRCARTFSPVRLKGVIDTLLRLPAPNQNVHRSRPNTLDELIGQGEIVNTLLRLIDGGDLPHLLFYGPPGTGKTSTILAIAKKVYGTQWRNMILELNASDDRGIGVVRDQIKSFAGTKQLFSSGTKLIILDEADAMTSQAQAALRRVIEMYTKNTRFCLICNYLSKIIPAIQSRCTRFRFSPLMSSAVEKRLREIFTAEQLKVTDDGVKALVRLGQGDMRRSLNILQSVSMTPDVVIDEKAVYTCTGSPLPEDVQGIAATLLNDDFNTAFANVSKVKTLKGLALLDIVSALHLYVLKIQFPGDECRDIVKKLADLEYRLATSTDEMLQLMSLVGIMQQAKESIGADDEDAGN